MSFYDGEQFDFQGLRRVLQRQLFQSESVHEQLVFAIPAVRKEDKKRKKRFLCLTLKNDAPVFQVVVEEKGVLRRKPYLNYINKLREIDAKCVPNTKEPSPDFAIMFHDSKTRFGWTAASIREKDEFIRWLYRLYRQYALGAEQLPIRFVNLDYVLEDELAREGIEMSQDKTDLKVRKTAMDDRKFSTGKAEAIILSAEDEEELRNVLELGKPFDFEMDKMLKGLNEEIMQMERANVHHLMSTHSDVDNVCRMIEQGLDDLNRLDTKIGKYYGLVENVTGQVKMMDETGYKVNVQRSNIQKLIDDISQSLEALDFPASHRTTIMDGDITDPRKLPDILKSADALTAVLRAKLPHGMENHPAIHDQRKLLKNLRKKFAERLVNHLANSFTSYSMGKKTTNISEEGALPDHGQWFKTIECYLPAVHWLQSNVKEPPLYQKLLNDYMQKMGDLATRELTEYFAMITRGITVVNESGDGKKGFEIWLGNDEEYNFTQTDIFMFRSYFSNVKRVFDEISIYVMRQQNFVMKFFNISPDVGQNISNGAQKGNQSSATKESPLRNAMRGIFRGLDDLLSQFLGTTERVSKVICMGMLVCVHDYFLKVEPDSVFLSQCYGSMLIVVKRNFDNFIRDQVQSVMNAKVPKRNRIGPLPFVCNFEHFTKLADQIFEGSSRRSDLDRALTNLLRQGIFIGINRIAHHKDCRVPSEVVFLENYHRLSDILSRLKIPALEDIRKETKQAHYDYRKSYVQAMLGKPLDKVQAFFDGVDAKIRSAGIQPHEVGFTTQFSKQELKKVLAMYPRNVVKKSLEQLYKRVEKQLSEEENLLQAIWHDMQREFLEQYQNYLRVIDLCYPGAQITFAFGIDDILKIFEEIAASH